MPLHKKAAKPVAKNKVKKTSPLPFAYEWARINYFFEFLDEEGPAEGLWAMLKLALIADNDLVTPRERSNMIFLYEHTKELFANVYTLLQAHNKKNNHQ